MKTEIDLFETLSEEELAQAKKKANAYDVASFASKSTTTECMKITNLLSKETKKYIKCKGFVSHRNELDIGHPDGSVLFKFDSQFTGVANRTADFKSLAEKAGVNIPEHELSRYAKAFFNSNLILDLKTKKMKNIYNNSKFTAIVNYLSKDIVNNFSKIYAITRQSKDTKYSDENHYMVTKKQHEKFVKNDDNSYAKTIKRMEREKKERKEQGKYIGKHQYHALEEEISYFNY